MFWEVQLNDASLLKAHTCWFTIPWKLWSYQSFHYVNLNNVIKVHLPELGLVCFVALLFVVSFSDCFSFFRSFFFPSLEELWEVEGGWSWQKHHRTICIRSYMTTHCANANRSRLKQYHQSHTIITISTNFFLRLRRHSLLLQERNCCTKLLIGDLNLNDIAMWSMWLAAIMLTGCIDMYELNHVSFKAWMDRHNREPHAYICNE